MAEGLPLAGIRVLDLTRLLPGGYCSLVLAQMGADVVKVEEPGPGDYLRWMPPLAEDGLSALFHALNRGKRSMALDLRTEAGRQALELLLPTTDVLLESFRPGVLARLGLEPTELMARHPRLVICSITGYGQDGPLRDRAGHDINYLALSGVLGISGSAEAGPGVPGVQVGDLGGGAQPAAIAILAALVGRQASGRGRWIDVAMTDGLVAWLSMHAGAFHQTGEVPAPGTMALNGRYPCYGVYRCGDGRHLAVGALEPRFWARFCAALGLPELVERQFAEGAEGAAARARVETVLAGRGRDEWASILAAADACVEPVLSFEETFAHPQVLARGMRVESRDRGPAQLRAAVDLGAGPLGLAPTLGQHTREILLEAGMGEAQARELAGHE